MENYSELASKILANETLVKTLEDVLETNCLNLVATDWQQRLENNATFQDYSTKKLWKPSYSTHSYTYEESKRHNFNVVVAAHCKFAKPYAGKFYKPGVIVMQSEPLGKIARAMTSDLDKGIQISDDFKFNFDECGILSCHTCMECSKYFTDAGFKITQINQPCIMNTAIYDGKRVVNRFLCHMESMFNQSFVAILLLNINVRYNFKDSNKHRCHRISGTALNVVGFSENKLTASDKKTNIGPLVTVDVNLKPSMAKNDCKLQDPDDMNEVERYMMEEDEKPKDPRKRKTAKKEEPETKKMKFIEEEDVVDGEITDDELLLEDLYC